MRGASIDADAEPSFGERCADDGGCDDGSGAATGRAATPLAAELLCDDGPHAPTLAELACRE